MYVWTNLKTITGSNAPAETSRRYRRTSNTHCFTYICIQESVLFWILFLTLAQQPPSYLKPETRSEIIYELPKDMSFILQNQQAEILLEIILMFISQIAMTPRIFTLIPRVRYIKRG